MLKMEKGERFEGAVHSTIADPWAGRGFRNRFDLLFAAQRIDKFDRNSLTAGENRSVSKLHTSSRGSFLRSATRSTNQL